MNDLEVALTNAAFGKALMSPQFGGTNFFGNSLKPLIARLHLAQALGLNVGASDCHLAMHCPTTVRLRYGHDCRC